ncbi:HAD hydrolase-like protein [Actinoplanes cyaneus]|uniref:HAD hydrolase-like protein n=1 Tax=Actinoplanes cyaneus TaxID=52696 RepID=UPI0022278414|nr:HAD hydrolase-like protein [Actinoplanes cyaneus]
MAAHDAPSDLWVVGDDRTTDILMACEADVTSGQVRTGKYADQCNCDDLPAPTHVIDSVADLPALLAAS